MGNVLVQTLLDGPVLALIAMGMTLVFGVLKFANVFQVTTATLGGYGTYLLMSSFGLGIVLSAVITMAAVGVLSMLLHHGLFRRLLSRNAATAMIGSLALSILVQALIQTIAGPQSRSLPLPLERGLTFLGGSITTDQVVAGFVGLGALLATLALLRFTSAGRQIRGVASNPILAEASGINSRRVIDAVWVLCGALGALAGILLAIETQVTPAMGFNLLLTVFAVALLGGFGSPGGAMVGGYLLAFAQAGVLQVNWGALVGTSAFVPTNYATAVGFVVLLLVLVARPEGLFGRRALRA
jgi:branched-chain amino acid transport system permease protein